MIPIECPVGSTGANADSSRSHAVLQILLKPKKNRKQITGKLISNQKKPGIQIFSILQFLSFYSFFPFSFFLFASFFLFSSSLFLFLILRVKEKKNYYFLDGRMRNWDEDVTMLCPNLLFVLADAGLHEFKADVCRKAGWMRIGKLTRNRSFEKTFCSTVTIPEALNGTMRVHIIYMMISLLSIFAGKLSFIDLAGSERGADRGEADQKTR